MLESDSKKYLWFLNTLVHIRISQQDGSDSISILEHKAPYADSPPLHIHINEDEIFHVIDGKFHFKVGGKEVNLINGEIYLAPKGIPHTYRIESKEGGHWITVMLGGDFEDFVREISRPAEKIELPKMKETLTPEEIEILAKTAKKHGIEIVGPPLH